MRAKVDATKAASTNIEEMMRALKGAARGQKQRSTRQSHQRDWLQTNADLQRQRTEAETARSLWLQAESERSAAEAVGAPLRDLAQAEDAAGTALLLSCPETVSTSTLIGSLTPLEITVHSCDEIGSHANRFQLAAATPSLE